MSKDKLSDVFDVTPMEIETPKPLKNIKTEEDFSVAREKILSNLDVGEDAMLEMLVLAKTSQNPRAFEVLATLLRANKELAETLMDIHNKKKKLESEQQPVQNFKQNNNLFVGSMKELLDEIKKNNDQQ